MKRSFFSQSPRLRPFLRIIVLSTIAFSLFAFVHIDLHPTTNANAAKRAPQRSRSEEKTNFFTIVSLQLEGASLESVLERYSTLYDFEYWLDRRVDPSTPIDCSTSDAPLIEAFDAIFSSAGLSFCIVNDSFLYVGPEDAADEALALFEIKRAEAFVYPPATAERLGSVVKFSTAPYSEPRDVLRALAQTARLKTTGFDKTPFDRWRGAEFNTICDSDILTLLFLGFNVEYDLDEKSGAIKPVAIDRNRKTQLYCADGAAKKINKAKFPKCDFNVDGTTVTGKFSDLVEVEKELSRVRRQNLSSVNEKATTSESNQPSSRRAVAASKQRRYQVSGAISNKTLGDVFDYLKKSADVYCYLDESIEATGVSLDTRISCEFKNADIRGIGAIIAKQIGAAADVEGNSIVFVKP